MSQGKLDRRHHQDFVRFETLRKEYLNQTFNFMPELQAKYDKAAKNLFYEEAQRQITEKLDYLREGIQAAMCLNAESVACFPAYCYNLSRVLKSFFFLICTLVLSLGFNNKLNENGTRDEQSTLAMAVDYFSQMLYYTRATKGIVDEVAIDIEKFVSSELARFENHRSIPLGLIISLSLFVPIVAYVTLQATTSMFQ